MNKPHKWAKEIKAWADGAEIEYYSNSVWLTWHEHVGWFEDYEYRIKPQPKEPQYLYVFYDNVGNYFLRPHTLKNPHETYIGKIKLENEDEF